MTSEYMPTKETLPYLNRAGRRAMAAHARKSKRRGSNFTKTKKRK